MSLTPPGSWSAIKSVFLAAIERPPEARQAFVDEACGSDERLRREVLSLLAAHQDEREFLDTMPFPDAAAAMKAALDDPASDATTLATGTRIGQYELLELIGSGGMADVYRARDTKLDRIVALKMVHDSVSATNDRALREARAASALNHPNICTLFEAGEFAGRPYLAMEYLDGYPLDSIIPPAGMEVGDVQRYGIQIAEALAHAHEHGVIHRDLKAANVVVSSEGRAKVLDFGVAKRVVAPGSGGSTSGTLSEAGKITGTVAYMAPELLHEKGADARSDIWALGVLLYELAAGRRPFTGESFELISAIMKDVPPQLPSSVPADLQAIIFRCLSRDPDARYQRAADLAAALRTCRRRDVFGVLRLIPRRRAVVALAATAAVAAAAYVGERWRLQPPGVAVLPFKVLSGEPTIAFLGIGVPDAIVSRIAPVRSIRVRALLAPGHEDDEPQSTGRSLGVDYVLTGTIQQGGDQIRIAPRLIQVADGAAIWTNTYTLAANDLLRLQDDIARGVAEALPVHMTSEDRARIERTYTQNPDAYALYMKGRDSLARNDEPTVKSAVASFESALDRDPTYVLAYAGLATACARMRLFFANEDEVNGWEQRAHQAAQRALTLDPELAQSHEALAAVYRSAEFDWPAVVEESTLALERDASLDQPRAFRASAFMHLGILDRVASEAKAATALNPANRAEPLRVQGAAAMFAGQYAEAVLLLEQSGAKSKDPTEWNLAYGYYNAGRKTEAEAMLRKLAAGRSARSQRRAQATLASVVAADGRREEASALIETVLRGSYMDHHVRYSLGVAYAQLGQPADAMTWLDKARNTGFPCYPWFARDPLLAPLRDTAAFQSFLAEFKRSWETKKAQFAAHQ